MRLNEANRRRALKRRRKLMPEPRRISANTQQSGDTEVIEETPVTPASRIEQVNLGRVDNPPAEPAVVQH